MTKLNKADWIKFPATSKCYYATYPREKCMCTGCIKNRLLADLRKLNEGFIDVKEIAKELEAVDMYDDDGKVCLQCLEQAIIEALKSG